MRRLALVFLVAAAAPAQDSGMVDRYLTGIENNLLRERAARVAHISGPAEVAERQRYIRAKVLEEIGGFPEKTPLKARITGTLEREGYRIEKVIYESQPRFFVTANLYLPAAGQAPYPAVIGVVGHSAAGKAYGLYQHVWIALAKRGFVVLAIDPPGQGERVAYPELRAGGTEEHTMYGLQCLLTGTALARYEMWDGIRAFDYLLTRPEVDPKRIAVAGNSGGGTQSAYLAVVEPRLAAAAPSCYITSWEKLWGGPGPQDAEQVFPNFLRDGLDFPDFLIAFAPKPILMLTAVRDFFPIDGARATYAEARRVFEADGSGDRVGFFEYDDPHGWSKPRREATYRWFAKWLQNRDDDGIEPEFAVEPESNLHCTPGGRVEGETVHTLNLAMAKRVFAARKRSGWQALAPASRGVPKAMLDAQGKLAAMTIEPEPGIQLAARLMAPEDKGRKPALLYVNPARADLDAYVRSGRIVLAFSPRGMGETAPRTAYQTAMRALLVGKTMLGMQVADVLCAYDLLASRKDVDPKRIAIAGNGNGGIAALFAAALERRIERVLVENAVLSYMDIVRTPKHTGIVDLVIPGVLRDFDLPDLARAIGPRPVWIAHPRTPEGTPADPDAVRAEYPRAHLGDAARWLE